MVVNYLNIFSISFNPTETNAKLIINAKTMMTGVVPERRRRRNTGAPSV